MSFDIQVRADAPAGTQIANSASITFDTNPPLVTNVWTSTVQTTGCGLTALCLNDGRFTVEVEWRATSVQLK
ncbi:MAG: hypothetical protein GY835_18565 [bacterium]|nr:hypothetical protein [bacterium]